MTYPPLWKASAQLAKAEAPDLASLLELASAPQAVLIAEDPFGPTAQVEALYTDEPDTALLSRLADLDTDLLVMGGYGHSRFRELMLGGATRRVLEAMTVPVFMAH